MKSRKFSSLNPTAKLTVDKDAIYHKVLSILLSSNCTRYSWYNLVSGFIRARDFTRLYKWADSVSTVVFETAAEHYAASQIAALVKKYPWDYREIGLESSPRDTAVVSFLNAEEHCRKTNKRFIRSLDRGYLKSRYSEQIEYMRRWIQHVLGETPDMSAIRANATFSSGSAIGVTGNATNLYRKLYCESLTCTPTCLPYARLIMWSNPHFALSLFPRDKSNFVCFDADAARNAFDARVRKVNENKVDFVPKTAKTHRSIAVEPLLNALVQKGIDGYMRTLLMRVGINLQDQSINASLAKAGSVSNELATIDLSAASDSLSIGLCKALLPADWFSLLNQTRSPSYLLDGKSFKYQKFVSMGNGFCFPLESLIFAAIARAAIRFSGSPSRTYSVYGDDIIVPKTCVDHLSRLLSFCGFIINKEKSFTDGPFRESCGADWYQGLDVRPVFLKFSLDSIQNLVIFHNSTRRSPRASLFFEEAREYLRNLVPYHKRLCRPDWATTNVPSQSKGIRNIEFLNTAGAFDVEMDTFMVSKFARWSRQLQRWRWHEYLFQPVLDIPADRDLKYQHASYIAFLLGSPKGKLALRRKTKVSIRLI